MEKSSTGTTKRASTMLKNIDVADTANMLTTESLAKSRVKYIVNIITGI